MTSNKFGWRVPLINEQRFLKTQASNIAALREANEK